MRKRVSPVLSWLKVLVPALALTGYGYAGTGVANTAETLYGTWVAHCMVFSSTVANALSGQEHYFQFGLGGSPGSGTGTAATITYGPRAAVMNNIAFETLQVLGGGELQGINGDRSVIGGSALIAGTGQVQVILNCINSNAGLSTMSLFTSTTMFVGVVPTYPGGMNQNGSMVDGWLYLAGPVKATNNIPVAIAITALPGPAHDSALSTLTTGTDAEMNNCWEMVKISDQATGGNSSGQGCFLATARRSR